MEAEYVKVQNGQVLEYPYDIQNFKALHPEAAMRWPPAPIALASDGIFLIEEGTMPDVSADQVAEPAPLPGLVDGLWTRHWVVRDRTPEEIADLEAELLARIDREAGEFRTRFITDVPGQAQTYAEKEREAREYQVDPNGTFPFLTFEAATTGASLAAVAALIIATADAWRQLGAAIEGLRMGAKQAVKDATTYSGKLAAAEVDWEALVP